MSVLRQTAHRTTGTDYTSLRLMGVKESQYFTHDFQSL